MRRCHAALAMSTESLHTTPTDDAATDPAEHSRLYQRLHRRYERELSLLPPGVPVQGTMEAAFASLQAEGHDLATAMRILRQIVMERVLRLDCNQTASLAEVMRAMTVLAELTLDAACRQARSQLDARHGVPQGDNGDEVDFWVIGMGKLGARELNVSSDIDLIYVYACDGETAGIEGDAGVQRGRISHHEYFGQVVKIIHGLIGEVTEHGCVFRVDLALRPNGNSGPAAVSLAALEEYLQVQGREWERFAWLKSRVVAPARSVQAEAVQALRSVVLPFVFRRYLDYNVFDSLRGLHRQIREHAARRSAGHPERSNDVKLSRGGIREIEFTVQLLQVVRGGQFPELRRRPTLDALERLAFAGLMPQETADALARAYVFLRRVEHRIQYLDDQQTHILPTRDDDLAWIASTLGCASCCAFLHELDMHREFVAQEFDTLLGGPSAGECNRGRCGKGKAGGPAAAPDMESLLGSLTGPLRERVAEWQGNARVESLRDEARTRLMRLVQRTALWVAEGQVDEEAAVRLVNWLEPLLRRESYLALLLERPAVHEQLLHLLGAARWPARYLQQHPGVIDELAGSEMLAERFVPADFERDLERRRASLQSTQEDDDEALLDLLRRSHHAETFRTLARDLESRITVEQVADDLSALADSVLRLTARWCWERLRNRHREEPRFGIIGYGKLGGKELGYGGDLDIVFVFDDDDDNAPEVYAAFVRKLINWLTVKTGEGDLFEIDTALRPNGNSGLLVISFESFSNYQQRRGSNTAWTWEHQAMTRARFVLGTPELQQRFDDVRTAVITAERDPAALAQEVISMRERVREAHPVPADKFDVKHSPGGMVDAEFAMQFLVLSQSRHCPVLIENVGNIKLMARAESAGLLPPGMGLSAGTAYRRLRKIQHRARLNEEPTRVAPDAVQTESDGVMALWNAVFAT